MDKKSYALATPNTSLKIQAELPLCVFSNIQIAFPPFVTLVFRPGSMGLFGVFMQSPTSKWVQSGMPPWAFWHSH